MLVLTGYSAAWIWSSGTAPTSVDSRGERRPGPGTNFKLLVNVVGGTSSCKAVVYLRGVGSAGPQHRDLDYHCPQVLIWQPRSAGSRAQGLVGEVGERALAEVQPEVGNVGLLDRPGVLARCLPPGHEQGR